MKTTDVCVDCSCSKTLGLAAAAAAGDGCHLLMAAAAVAQSGDGGCSDCWAQCELPHHTSATTDYQHAHLQTAQHCTQINEIIRVIFPIIKRICICNFRSRTITAINYAKIHTFDTKEVVTHTGIY